MGRRKIEPITHLAPEDKLTVQKSLPLFSLWRSSITLPEFKILDTYLARIDSHKPNQRTVTFGKGELEEKLGLKKIDVPVLKKRLHNLMTPIIIEEDPTRDYFKMITLFEEAAAIRDEYEQWQISMTCTEAAMKYIFNIENLGYLRYKLRCITSITSRYTYIMFLYLEQNRFRRSWEVSVDNLKHVLDCDRVETYSAFKDFNKLILKRIQKELHEKTECRYTYEPIKKGRMVASIRFTVETNPEIDYAPAQITLDQLEGTADRELWETALSEFEFTHAQLDELRSILAVVPDHRLPEDPNYGDNLAIRRYHYMDIKKAAMNRQGDVKHKFAYLLQILKTDAGID